METLAKRIAHLRRCTGLGPSRFSEIVGLTRCHVHKIESGKMAEPSITTIGAIAQATGVDVNWILFGKGRLLQNERIALNFISHVIRRAKAGFELSSDAEQHAAVEGEAA